MTTTAEPIKGVPRLEGNSTLSLRSDFNDLADWTFDHVGASVATVGDLPITGNYYNRQVRVVADDTAWVWLGSGPGWVEISGDTDWITPTLGSGWTAVGGEEPKYRRLNGVVFLSGRATSTGAAATAFVVGVGFRPAVNVVGITDANSAAIRYAVNATGAVGQTAAAAVTAFSFGGMSPFIAEA